MLCFKLTISWLLILPAIVYGACRLDAIKWPPTPPSKCYTFPHLANATFAEAQAHCRQMDPPGDLVSIHDVFTNMFLMEQSYANYGAVTTEYWLGAYTGNDTWAWSDDSKPDFVSWVNDVNFSKDDFCGVQNVLNANWELVNCSLAKPFVCAYDEFF